MTHRVSVAELTAVLLRLFDYSFAGRQNNYMRLQSSSIEFKVSVVKV
jgi:hypothetical protein